MIGTVTREVARPVTRRRIAAAIDAQLAALHETPGSVASETRRLTAAVAAVTARRDRLVAMMAAGSVPESDGAATLAVIRSELVAAEYARDAMLARTTATRTTSAQLDATRTRVLALAADFVGMCQRVSGAALREILRPWIAGATFDKITRELIVTIRHIPADSGMSAVPTRGMPGRAADKYGADVAGQGRRGVTGVTVRRVSLARAGHGSRT